MRNRLFRAATAAVLTAVFAVGALYAQEAARITEGMDALRNAAADRDLPAAEEAFATLNGLEPGFDLLDEGRLLLGKTRMIAGDPAGAANAVTSVVDRPGSAWHVKALYLTAESAARRRNWKQAADVYAARVEWAAGDLRRDEIAQLYREIADAAFLGDVHTDGFGRERRVPDWAGALRHYDKARSIHVPADDRALVSYRIAKSRLEVGDAAGANREWTALLEAGAGEWADDSLYGKGRALGLLRQRAEARKTFVELREDHGDSPFAPLALIRIGESWVANGINAETLRQALAPWRRFLELHPKHEEAANVAFRIAETQSSAGKPRDAAASYADFLERFPDETRAPSAQDRIGQAYLDLRDFDRAVAEWRKLLARWPNHPLWAQAQRKVAQASFVKGKTAFDEKQDDTARTALTAFLEGFPVDALAPEAQRLLGEISARAGEHEKAVEEWRLATTKYPRSASAPKAALRIAATYEGPLADLEKALSEYEDVAVKWPRSPEARAARTILAQMKGKTLDVTVARPFRTDETVAVPMRLRNVAKLRMKAYRIDPAEYAGRKGGLAGVEQVEVDIVKPAHAWDHEVSEYERYRLLDRSVALPLKGPGAWIVTAAEQKFTATFLVVVSDLTTIVKSANGQALVFVFDERTGKPVPGARVHLLDGNLHGVTGADGVWRKDKGAPARMRAIVTGDGSHAGHFVFSDANAGPATAFGYTSKAFLHTDRPLYRPGDTVNLRGIVRQVANGRYATRKGLKVPVTVTDPRGAMLLDEQLLTDDFGVVHHALELAPEPTLGTYSIRATVDGRTFERAFDVLAYKKPDVLVRVTPESSTYLVGDEVKANVSLRFRVGGSVAGANVRWSVFTGPFTFDPSVHESFSWFFRDAKREAELRRRAAAGARLFAQGEGVTDKDGGLAITFRPDVVEEDRTYTLVVEAQDPNRRWVQASSGVPVTRKGAYVICRTEKKVYRPGEKVVLEVTAVSPLHVPLAQEGEGVLVRRRRVAQHFVEDEVARVAAKTGADGRATIEMRADKAGEYIARFVTKDTKDNQVEGSTPVTLSGEAEDLETQAKLVADREFYREGDVAKVLVNVPSAPSPVLITYEGENVLEHQVYMATERSNTLELPLTARHAPNVFLRMAVAKDGKLHQDGDEVAVFQYLNVAVRASRDVVRPGESVEIEVETTDQSGNPVEAEVSLDVIDAAIYQLAADVTPQIKPFFYDQRRTHGVRTASSAGAAMPAITRPTNPDLLFEQMRRLGKKRFEEMRENVRRAEKYIQQGKTQEAMKALVDALEIAPGDYRARALLGELESRKNASQDKAVRLAESLRDRRRPPAAKKPGAPKPEPAAADDSPFEGKGENGTVGIGGGAGGKFGGRRGGRKQKGKKSKDAKEAQDEEHDGGPTTGSAGRDPSSLFADMDLLASAASLLDNAKAGAALRLAQAAAPIVPPTLRQRFLDTALSRPTVRTGKDGKAKVEVELPDNLTEWRVTARGAGRASLVGEGRTTFRAAKDLLIRADMPRFLTQGDSTLGTGTVHSSLEQPVEVTVRFSPDGMEIKGDAETKVELPAGGVRPFGVSLGTPGHGLGTLRADALSSVESDAAQIAIPVIPYGRRDLDGASGLLTEEAFAKLTLPAKTVDGTVSLTVTLSPSIDIALLESLAYTSSYPWGCVEQTVNRFLPAVAAREALDAAGSPNERLKRRLDESVRRGLAALYSMQRDDGSFGWFGAVRRGANDKAGIPSDENTAYAVLGMVRAERAGYRVSAANRDRAVVALKKIMNGRGANRLAFSLYALAHAKSASLEDLTRLHRQRHQLDARGLSLLALAMHLTGRPSNALEATQALAAKVQRDGEFAHWDSKAIADMYRRWIRHVPVNVEPTAYALLALITVEPESALIDGAAAWVSSNRRGPAWRSTRDTAIAIEALAQHARLRGIERAEGEVQVFVNDGADAVATVTFGGPSERPVDAPVTLSIPADKLQAGENRVILRRKGTGRVHWSALLASVIEPEGEKPIAKSEKLVNVSRKYVEWVRPKLPGETVATRIVPGWSVVKSKHRPKGWAGRPLRRAGTGDKVRVHLNVRSYSPLGNVILEDPLPAGFEVVTGSATGPFDREERRDDRQVFFFASVSNSVSVSYVLQAIHPGTYRALPASARPMYEPEMHGWSKEARVTIEPEPGLVGLPPTADEITPDEIWGLALRAYGEKDWSTAREGIEDLMKRYELVPSIEEEAFARLFVIGLELGDDELAVKSYEALVERNPRRRTKDLRLRRLLANAFQGVGDHERALVLYRDLVREHFAADSEAAAAYGAIGDPWRQSHLLFAALRRAPDSEWANAVELQAAKATAARRASIPIGKAEDGEPLRRVPGTSAVQPLLLDLAVAQMRSFQAHHADSRMAHEAGFLTVQALLRMDLADDVIEEGTRFLGRHRKSRYLDDVTFLVAEGHFAAGDYDRATGVARDLMKGKFPRDDNPKQMAPSPYRAKAIHLTAKVAHLRGKLDEAVALYRQVEGLFPDARDAREFLTAKGLQLDEVESVAVGGTAKLHLRRKNVAEVRLQAYAVDFMILYALRRNLAGVNKIDLSGVAPEREWTVKRRGPEDYQWHAEEVELPVKEKGVYLVVGRGGNLDASSVVLVSDLEVSVQETQGRLRIYTSRRGTGAPWGEVYVKVGDGRQIKAQGFTDARGVFEAPGVGGSISVVAEQDGHVALWRR